MEKKLGAFCALVVAVCVLFGAATPPAMAQDAVAERAPAKPKRIGEGGRSDGGGSSCSYDPDNNTCAPADLNECLEDCAYRHGREIEACSRKRDKKKREACYAKANERNARCRRDCAKKYPEK